MKQLLTIFMTLSTISFADSDIFYTAYGDTPMMPFSMTVQNRVPIDLNTIRQLRTYASTNNYYFGINLRHGQRVMYSVSYGTQGEAGQARGVVIEKDGRFWFKQQANPTGQLLLPPGQVINSNNEHSMWDIGSYMELVNRVAFSAPSANYHTANDVYSTAPEAALVDFTGGTAGQSVHYKGALEVVFKHSVSGRSKSEWKAYYSKGIGPVALEFREDKSPSGVFKFYLGE